MGKLKAHWTESSIDDFLYRVGFDYIQQIEKAMDGTRTTQAGLARSLGVTEGRVSQILHNPGNLTLKKMIECARVFGRKVAVITYDDGDPENRNGPINSELFEVCWQRTGKPRDFFALRETRMRSAENIRRAVQRDTTFHFDENEADANLAGYEILTDIGGAAEAAASTHSSERLEV